MNETYNSTFESDLYNQTITEDIEYPAESMRAIILSALSLISTFSVILTYLIFFKQLGNKITYTIIFWLFLSNFVYSLGTVVGYQNETNFACLWLAIIGNIGTLCNVCWQILLSYLLYAIVAKGNKFELKYYHHLICWGISIFFTLIPYSNAKYGSDDDGYYVWCWLRTTEDSPEWAEQLWFWLSYYFWIWLGIIVVIGFYIMSFLKIKFNKKASEQTLKNFYTTLYSICGYQIIMIIIWGLMCTVDFYSYYFYEESLINPITTNISLWIYDFAIGIGILYTIYFWLYNKNCRNLWYDFYKAGFSISKFNERLHTQSQITQINSSTHQSTKSRSQIVAVHKK